MAPTISSRWCSATLGIRTGTHDQYSDAAYYLLSRVVSKNPACG
ncbi:MAG: hypothetical protein ACLTDS_09040 [Bianqueaceae bacterium]